MKRKFLRADPLSNFLQAKYWDYSRNSDTPKKVSSTSSDKKIFICKNGHSSLRSIRTVMKKEELFSKECSKIANFVNNSEEERKVSKLVEDNAENLTVLSALNTVSPDYETSEKDNWGRNQNYLV